MRVSEPEVLLDGLYFPECLRWHDGRLWFVDMLRGTVHSTDPAGSAPTTEATLPGLSGGLGWLPDGDLVTVAMTERQLLRRDSGGRLHLHADLTRVLDHPANDLYVAEDGRCYVSSYGYDADNGAPIRPVPLVLVEPDGTARRTGPPLVFPNGIVPHADGGLMVAETFADRLTRLHRHPDGTLAPDRADTLLTLPPGDGPDGIDRDAHGGAWIACAFGHRAVHVTAHGRIDAEVPVDSDLGVLCCLVSPDQRTLYLAVAHAADETYAARHTTGRILTVHLD